MREPEQGVLVEGCYYCKLLYPDAGEACPHCGGGLRFVAAQMMSEELVRERIEQGASACGAASTPPERRECVTQLLKTIFVHGPMAKRLAAEMGWDLDRLRIEYETSGQA